MSLPTDSTHFASFFDFDSDRVSVADLIDHLRVMGAHPEVAGVNNALAALAAADLLEDGWKGNASIAREGELIATLADIDAEKWSK